MYFLINRLNEQQKVGFAQATNNAIQTLSNIHVQNISGTTANETIMNFFSKFLAFSKNHGYSLFLQNNSILKIRGANHNNGVDENYHQFEIMGLPNIRLSLVFANADGIPQTHNDKYGVPITEHIMFVGHLYNEEDLQLICRSIIGYLQSGKYTPPTFKQAMSKGYHQAKTNRKKKVIKQMKMQKKAQQNHRQKILTNKGVKRNELKETIDRIITETLNRVMREIILKENLKKKKPHLY